jgi:hypothetical protein
VWWWWRRVVIQTKGHNLIFMLSCSQDCQHGCDLMLVLASLQALTDKTLHDFSPPKWSPITTILLLLWIKKFKVFSKMEIKQSSYDFQTWIHRNFSLEFVICIFCCYIPNSCKGYDGQIVWIYRFCRMGVAQCKGSWGHIMPIFRVPSIVELYSHN